MRLRPLGSSAWTVPISISCIACYRMGATVKHGPPSNTGHCQTRANVKHGPTPNTCNDGIKHSITTAVRKLRSSLYSHSTGRSFFREQLAPQSLRFWGGSDLLSVSHSMLRCLYSRQRVCLVLTPTKSPMCSGHEDSLQRDSS